MPDQWIDLLQNILPFLMLLTSMRMSASISIRDMIVWYRYQTGLLILIVFLAALKDVEGGFSILLILLVIAPLFLLWTINMFLRYATLEFPVEKKTGLGWKKIWTMISYYRSKEATRKSLNEWRGLGKSRIGQRLSILIDIGLACFSFFVSYQIGQHSILQIDINSLAITIALLLSGLFTIYNKNDNILSSWLGFLVVDQSAFFMAVKTIEQSKTEQTIPIVVLLLYVSIPLVVYLWFLPTRRRVFGNIRTQPLDTLTR